MKRTSKTLVAVLAGSLLLGGAGAALAFGGPGKGGCDRDGFAPTRAVMNLDDLTDGQRAQIDALRQEQRDAMRKQMEAMRDARRELRDAMNSGADAATIRALADKQGAQVSAMIVARSEVRAKLDSILTREQREQLKERSQQRFDSMDHLRHGW